MNIINVMTLVLNTAAVPVVVNASVKFATKASLLNLSVNNLLLILTSLVITNLVTPPAVADGGTVCHVTMLAFQYLYTLEHVSVLIIVTNNLCAVKFPFRYQVWSRRHRVMTLLASAWLGTAMVGLLFYGLSRHGRDVTSATCKISQFQSPSVPVVWIVLRIVLDAGSVLENAIVCMAVRKVKRNVQPCPCMSYYHTDAVRMLVRCVNDIGLPALYHGCVFDEESPNGRTPRDIDTDNGDGSSSSGHNHLRVNPTNQIPMATITPPPPPHSSTQTSSSAAEVRHKRGVYQCISLVIISTASFAVNFPITACMMYVVLGPADIPAAFKQTLRHVLLHARILHCLVPCLYFWRYTDGKEARDKLRKLLARLREFCAAANVQNENHP